MKSEWIFTLVCVAGLSSATLNGQDAMPITNQKAHQIDRTIKKRIQANYLLFLPKDYQPKGTNRWPMILFLHGAGERGTNLSRVSVHGPPKIVKTQPDFPFILVSPQCPANQRWDNDVLLTLLDEVETRYKVDKTRIYLTGLSMGGYGTWSLGIAYPERFAAIAPICGGGELIDVLLASRTKASALKTLPLWAFHGAKDPVVKLAESERMVNALKTAGCKDVELTVYRDAGHDAWTETYNNPQLFDWFLKHTR